MRKHLLLLLLLAAALLLAGCTAATVSGTDTSKKKVTSTNLQDFGMILTEQDGLVVVLAVQEDSSAELCGIHAGDSILKIRDTEITNITQVESTLFTDESGEMVLQRNEEELRLSLPLMEL